MSHSSYLENKVEDLIEENKTLTAQLEKLKEYLPPHTIACKQYGPLGNCERCQVDKLLEGGMSEDIMYGKPSDILKYIKELETQLAKTEKVIKEYNKNVDYYQGELAGSWLEIRESARAYFKDKE